jgi:Pvc16 N-terminal domain
LPPPPTALRHLLQSALDADMPGATVTTVKPSAVAATTAGPELNIFLYQVVPNAALRNADLPTRRADHTLLQRPQTALDLHYLISCYGTEVGLLEPQRLLGCAVAALHARPTLSRELIAEAISGTTLSGSDLADQVEAIRFVPLSLNLEELSKLWSVFFQTPYALSVAYQASVVLIDADLTPQRSLPVRKASSYSAPFQQPIITQIRALRAADLQPKLPSEPIVAGDVLLIEGERLLGDDLTLDRARVDVGAVELHPDAGANAALRVTLGSHRLRAGIQGLQVVHLMAIGEPPEPHRIVSSNAAPLTLRPTIIRFALDNLTIDQNMYDADLVITCAPGIGRLQRAALLLNEANPPDHRRAWAYHFDARARVPITKVAEAVRAARARAARFTTEPAASAAAHVAGAAADAASTADASLAFVRAAMAAAIEQAVAALGTEDEQRRARTAAGIIADVIDGTDEITFPITRVRPAQYFVRVQIDGVESPLTIDNEQFVGPKVTIP